MKWTGLNEIREKYLSFFESKEHLRLQSFSLVPHNDKSLFLINSGMAPMKKYFLGQEVPPKKRVTTCQKCIRTPDIENVGKTARHGTFFEMLGNFSFGDYFKEDAIKFAWEFLTKALEIPAEKLWVTVFESDDEAEKIWVEKIGFPKEKIVRLGKADNFWEHGSGPCGPCSEIHFDRGEKYGPFINFEQASDCDRIIEIWNLVFSQFDNDGKGNYTELENKNIDTGMGLERLACAMQDVNNLFEVDTIQNIMNHISNIAGVKYKEDNKTDISLRVITDHIRSTTFMIGDGILPSNEGRGYVLRRLLRRAARHGRLLGINKPFLYEVVDTVAKENKVAYPELTDKIEYIKKIVLTEEENFAKTIDKGMELLNNLIDNIDGNIISGQDAFKLYDTYGFPIDLTKEIIMEKNLQIDEEEFVNLMEQQRVRARNARATDDAFGFTSDQLNLDGIKTEFTGYAKMQDESVISAIIYDGEQVSTISAPAKVSVITENTPFYAESGGQVADRGQILCPNGILEVCDVKKMNGIIVHHCELISGVANKDEKVTLKVDKKLRRDITRNHTAAHLLQAALINVLGEHVHQAGQLVNAEHLRFDFSHFEPVSEQQLVQIENQVNHIILKAIDVYKYETDIESAKKKGAMALFGEKYGDIVRVCEIEDFSIELCGGTHVDNTSNLGLFKIVSESSVASGVRRIEAVTGYGVLDLFNKKNDMLNMAAREMKLQNTADIVNKISLLMTELKEKNNEIDSLTQKLADSKMSGLFENIQTAGKVNYITALLSGTKTDALRALGDKIKEQAPNAVGLLVGSFEEKYTMLCVCGKTAIDNGAHAGKIVSKAAAIAGGKGGGKADSAMAGITDNHKIDEAFDMLPKIIKEVVEA